MWVHIRSAMRGLDICKQGFIALKYEVELFMHRLRLLLCLAMLGLDICKHVYIPLNLWKFNKELFDMRSRRCCFTRSHRVSKLPTTLTSMLVLELPLPNDEQQITKLCWWLFINNLIYTKTLTVFECVKYVIIIAPEKMRFKCVLLRRRCT